MTLPMGDNGLPKPGRELDAAVWEMLGYEVRQDDVGEYRYACILPRLPGMQYDPIQWLPMPLISTSHACFQVMEEAIPNAKVDGCIRWQYDRLFVKLSGCDWVGVPWLKTFEKTLAWAVCCCLYLAKGGDTGD